MSLEHGPLFRSMLLRINGIEHRIIFTFQHLIYDPESIEIFYHELSVIYAALCNGNSHSLPETTLQFADYAVYQHKKWNEGGVHSQKILEWWKQYWSAPMPDAPKLPSLWKIKPEAPKISDSILIWEIPAELLREVKALSSSEGTTHFMTFFAAFQIVLFQLTGQEELVVGTNMSGRSRRELDGMIGYFINRLALRVNMAGQPTIREVLHRSRETIQLASAYQELPFNVLAREFSKEKLPVPPVQVVFQLIKDFNTSFHISGLEVDCWRESEQLKMPWGMNFSIRECAGGITCVRPRFDSGLYDPAGVAEMVRLYGEVLQTMTTNPEMRICAITTDRMSAQFTHEETKNTRYRQYL